MDIRFNMYFKHLYIFILSYHNIKIMATTSILELRQSESNLVVANGDYTSELGKDIVINNGDVLALKSAFIDTKPEGNIVIDSDTTLTIQYMPYITDWLQNDFKQSYYNRDNSEDLGTKTVNGMDFVPYYYTIGGTLDGYETVTAVNYVSYPPLVPSPYLVTTYSYINVTGQTIVFHTNVYGAFDPPVEGTPVQDVLSNIIAKIGSFKLLTSPQAMANSSIAYASSNPIVISPTPPTLDTWNPYIFEANVVIPQGNYSPSYLSLYISEKLSQNNSQNLPTIKRIMETPFLKMASDYDPGKPFPNGALNPDGTPMLIGTQGSMFISTDNSLRFQFQAGSNLFIGTSQVALEYDTDSNKMVWQFLHFPMYDNVSGTNISVRYQYYNNNPANDIIATAKNGGVLLTGLIAVDINGKGVDFWNDILGFDLSKICVNSHAGYLDTVLGLSGFVQTFGPTVHGLNMTTGFYGIDTVVFKQQDKWYGEEPLVNFDDNVLCSTINNTVALEASTTINELINKYSHYIIQADFTLCNTFIGADTFRNITGIISKYYSDNNYTFADNSGAIEYVHRGMPVQLKSVKIRILTSSKVLDPELGPDNTIYFEIIKQPQNIKN